MSTVAAPIEVRGLTKTYRIGFWMNRRVRALQSLDLTVEPGKIYGLLGPNGAGKSTTIKILMNLVYPTSGEAKLFGVPVSSRLARQHVGFVPENPTPYEYLTGREFVRLAGSLGGLSGAELDARAREVLGAVDMERTADLQVRRYSKGMLQRIVLAQALVTRPKLLVLDEPTSGLDPVGRRQIRDLILAERERGTTVLFCTHIIPDVEALCDRVAVLVQGRLVKEGSVRDLVTSSVPLVEVTLEGLDLARLQSLGFALESMNPVGERVIVRVKAELSQGFVRAVIDAGGRISALQPARFSLEDQFMQTLESTGKTFTGGEIA